MDSSLTPKNTPLSLKIGKNFDLKVTETLTKRNKGSWYKEEDVKYSIKNSSNENKKVELQIPFNRNEGSSVESDKKHTFIKGNIVSFSVNVKANSTEKFSVYESRDNSLSTCFMKTFSERSQGHAQ